MYSSEKRLGLNRLGVFVDSYIDNSFIVKNSKEVFARINKINDAWYVWFYKSHTQKQFNKLKEALHEINSIFIKWYKETYQ